MKTKIKHLSKCALSAVLAVAMLMSTTLVGSVSAVGTAETTETQTEAVQNDTAEPAAEQTAEETEQKNDAEEAVAAAVPEKKALQTSGGTGDTVDWYVVGKVGEDNYNDSRTDYQFVEEETGLYKMETGLPLSDWYNSGTNATTRNFMFRHNNATYGFAMTGKYNNKNRFAIREPGWVTNNNNGYDLKGSDNKMALITGSSAVSLIFRFDPGTDADKNVIFWIQEDNSTFNLYYTLEEESETTTYSFYDYNSAFTPTKAYVGTSESSVTTEVSVTNAGSNIYTVAVPNGSTHIKWYDGTNYTIITELTGNENNYFVPGTNIVNGAKFGSWQTEKPGDGTWYLVGRFGDTKTAHKGSGSWSLEWTTHSLTFDATVGKYKYVSDSTISEINTNSLSNGGDGAVFMVRKKTGSTWSDTYYKNNADTPFTGNNDYGVDHARTLYGSTDSDASYNLQFHGATANLSSDVTLWFDTSGSDYKFYYTLESYEATTYHYAYFYNVLGWSNVQAKLASGASLGIAADPDTGSNWYKVSIPNSASGDIYFTGTRPDYENKTVRTAAYTCPSTSSTNKYFIPLNYTASIDGVNAVECLVQSDTNDEITLQSGHTYIYLDKNNVISNWARVFAHMFEKDSNPLNETAWQGYRFRKVKDQTNLYAIDITDSTFNAYNRIIVTDGTDGNNAWEDAHNQKTHRFLQYDIQRNNVFTPLSTYDTEVDNNNTVTRKKAEWHDLELPLSAVDTANNKVRVYAKTGTIRLDGGDEFDKYSRLADVKIAFKNTNASTSVQTAYTVDGSKEQVNVGDSTSTNRELAGVYYKRSAYYDTETTPGKHYRKVIADVDKAQPVTITVTLRTDTTNNLIDRYYVKAFVINGETVQTFTHSSSGIYSYTFTPSTTYGNYIEVTPVYYYNESSSYNTISGGTSKYITLQVDDYAKTVNGSSVKAIWGSTLSVYAWYNPSINRSTSVADAADGSGIPALGGYPGQPMIYVNGHYEMQIPRYLNGDKSKTVKGITLNNYTWDDAHTEIVEMMKTQNETNLNTFAGTQAATVTSKNERNCQTYDYDDFIALSQLDAAKIRFTFKYRTYNSTGKDSTLEGTAAKSGNFAGGTTLEINAEQNANNLGFVTGSGGNGWEALMDDENIPVDLFNRKVLYNENYHNLDTGGDLTNTNYLTQAFVETLPSKAANVYNDLVYVVSDGYENYYEYNKDENNKKTGDPVNEYIGEYATRWYVYKRNSSDGTFNFLGSLPPSAFLSDAIKADESLDSTKYLNYSSTATEYKGSGRSYINSGKAPYTTYESLYNACKGLPVVIAYESSLYSEGRQQATANKGNRSDGRWTYSPESPTVQAKVKIQIVTEDSNGNLESTRADDFSQTTVYQGTTTKANAYFTNSEFNKTVDSGTVIKNAAKNFSFTASPYSVNGDNVYVFAGWYYINELKDSPTISTDTYTHVNSGSNLLSTTGSVPMNSDYTFIAAYKEAEGKQIIFSHQLYSVADTSNIETYQNIEKEINPIPAVHNGTGKTEIKVEVYKDGTKQSIDGLPDDYTEASVTLTSVNFTEALSTGSVNSAYTFKVYLRTTPDTENTLQKMLKIPGNSGTDLGLITETTSATVTTQEYTLTADQINALFGSGSIASVRNYSDLSSNNVSIRFNYYDRAVYNGAMAEDISKTPTSLTVDQTRDTTGNTGIAKLENTVVSAMHTNKIVTGEDETSVISSVLDIYSFWPTQAAAKDAVAQRTNLRTGKPYGDSDADKHFDYYGFASKESVAASDTAPAHIYAGKHTGYSENWVTYYDAAKEVVSVNDANKDPLQVASIEVWGLNVPKEYTVHFEYPKTAEEVAAGKNYTGSGSFTGYYNERVGREYKDSDVDGLSPYLKNYGVKLSTRTRSDITAPASFEKTEGNTTTYYFFDGWINESGVKVSTDRTYANRITGNMTLTAHYTSQTTNVKPVVENSVTVTSNGVENYISDKNVERVRLLTQINVNGYQNENTGNSDKSINQMAMIYVKLPSTASPENWTPNQKSAIYTSIQIAVQNALNNAMVSNTTTNPTGVSVFTVTMTGLEISSLNLGTDQNTIAYTYDVVWENNNYDGETNGTEITLTNKNRIQFSLDLKKSSVQGGANSNIIAVAAIKADREGNNEDDNKWIMSKDGVVYYYDSNTTTTKTLIVSSGSTEEVVNLQEDVDVIPVSANIENLQIYSVSDNVTTEIN